MTDLETQIAQSEAWREAEAKLRYWTDGFREECESEEPDPARLTDYARMAAHKAKDLLALPRPAILWTRGAPVEPKHADCVFAAYMNGTHRVLATCVYRKKLGWCDDHVGRVILHHDILAHVALEG